MPTPPSTARQRIYDAVRRFPGIHLREIERQTGESAQLAEYHLGKLAADGYVDARGFGGYTRFFPTSKGKAARVTEHDKVALSVLREAVPLHIALVLLDDGPLTHSQIVERVGVAKSTVSYHLTKLAEAKVVVRDGKLIRLADRDATYRLLLTYKPTPGLLDAFGDLWESLYG